MKEILLLLFAPIYMIFWGLPKICIQCLWEVIIGDADEPEHRLQIFWRLFALLIVAVLQILFLEFWLIIFMVILIMSPFAYALWVCFVFGRAIYIWATK
jgi:hypothetical protein